MVRPLTRRTGNGDRYTRPPNIEAAIDVALALDWPALQERAFIRDRRATDYLPSECLVHLIRQAHRERHDTIRDQLLAILLRALRGHPRRHAAGQPRAERRVCQRRGPRPAGRTLRRGWHRRPSGRARLLRGALQCRLRRLAHRPCASGGEGAPPVLACPRRRGDGPPAGGGAAHPATPEHGLFLNQLADAIQTLPPDEREAVILCHIMGYAEEADDPAKRTAATICGVTGRTIRNRLTRAAAKLSRFKEDR